MMANAARHEPEAVAALRAGRDDRMNRLLRLPLPEPYAPTRVEALRDRLRSRSQPAKPERKAPAAHAKRPARPPVVERRSSRAGHHGDAQRYTGQRRAHAGRRALEGQRYG
jgi:cell division protein FtsW